MMMKTRVKKWQWKWNLTWTGTWTWTSKWLEHKHENENGHGHENEHEMKMNMKMKIWKWKWGWGWNWKWKWKWGWGWKWKEWKWNWTCIFFGRNPSQVLLKNMWRNWLDCYKLWACMATGMLARQEKQQRFNSAIRFWGVRGNVLLSFWNTWTWNQLNMKPVKHDPLDANTWRVCCCSQGNHVCKLCMGCKLNACQIVSHWL